MKPALLLCLVGLMMVTPAAFTRDLTLSDALTLAREHSLDVQRAQAEQLAADEALGAAKALRYPTIDATTLAFYNTDIASLEIPTSAGIISRELGTKENYQADLRLALPLYTGGRLASGIAAAESGHRRQAALTEAAITDVLYRTRMQYLAVHRSDKEIAAVESSLRRVRLMREQVESLLAAGAADSVAVLEAQLAINEAQLRLQQAIHDRRTAEIRLAQLVGLPVDDSLNLITAIPQPSAPERIANAAVRPELAAAAAAVNAASAQATQAGAAWYPSVSAFGGYSYGKPNLDRFNNTWNEYWQIGARLEWSFNLGFATKRQVSRAEYLVRAAESRRDHLDEQFREQQLLAWESLHLAFDRYQTARERTEITSRNYQLAQSQHSEGVLSSNRLLEIEATLSEAEAALAAVEAGYYIARSTYLYAIGADLLMEGF